MKDFSGKVAFITGGASGIGLGMARAFLRAGMRVAIADRNRDALELAAQSLNGDRGQVLALALDVTDRTAMRAAADEAHRVFGKIHLLCPNAGVTDAGFLSETTYEQWDWMMGVNLGGVVNTVTTFLPRMLAHGDEGHIVATSSMGGLTPIPHSAVYCVAKNAVIGMMEALRMELSGSSIGVSVLCPGLTRTGIFSTRSMQPSTSTSQPHGARIEGPAHSQPDDDPMRLAMDPAELGERVLRGIRRGDLYILTHAELRDLIREQFEPLVTAAPEAGPGELVEALPGADATAGSGIPTPYLSAVGHDPIDIKAG